jgi:hypothetical protein
MMDGGDEERPLMDRGHEERPLTDGGHEERPLMEGGDEKRLHTCPPVYDKPAFGSIQKVAVFI